MARAVGVVVALAGACILTLHKFRAPDTNGLWIVIALGGPVCLAVGNLYRTLRWPEGMSADALAAGMLIAAAFMLLGIGFIPGFSLAVPFDQSLPLALIGAQAVIFAGIFLLLLILQRAGGPVLLSLLGSVGAVVAIPIAIFLQGEAPAQGLLPSAIMITTGIVLLSFGNAKSVQPSNFYKEEASR